MKLIDMVVEELPKRGGWPKRANCITQDGDLRVEPATCHPSVAKCYDDGFWFLDSSRTGGFKVDTLASDYTTAIITREQYEAALAAKNDGWIEWGGGKIPVDNATVVDIKFRSDVIASGVESAAYYWPHTGYESDIIAYRLHQTQEAEKVRAAAWNAYAGIAEVSGDKADLNDCIGQDATPAWSGEGLPPVGCFCEVEDLDGMLVYGQGESGEVIAHFENTAVIRMSYGLGCFKARFLRPLRTEADKKRDAAIKELTFVICGEILDTGMATAAMYAARIYDAGYRKGGE